MAPTKTEVFIEATSKGFETVVKAVNDLSESLGKIGSKAPAGISRLTSEMSKLKGEISNLNEGMEKIVTSLDKTSASGGKGTKVFQEMEWSVKSFASSMEYLIQVQIRWYGTRLILDTIAKGFANLTTGTFEYVSALSQASAEMLRFSATGGEVTSNQRKTVDNIIKQIRQQTMERPVSVKDMSEMAQQFVGAGVAETTVADMIPMLAQLKTAFKEIDMKQFSVSIVGAFNVFKDSITEATTEAGKFQVIIETLLRAQSVGIIRPEDFTKVMQYMSQTAYLSGITLQEMTALAVTVTETGEKASRAGRLISSFMLALQQPKARMELERIGVQLDKNQSLGAQFDKIMQGLLKLADFSKGNVSTGVMSFLGGMMGKEQVRDFITLLAKYDETYLKLKGDLSTGAAGGLKRAADIMTATPKAQWDIFLNVIGALGTAITNLNEGALKGFVGTLVDLSRGILFALDSSGTFVDKMYLLGDAGKEVYSVFIVVKDSIKELSTLFSTLGQGILFPIKGLKDILVAITDTQIGASALSGILTASLIRLAFPALYTAVTTLVAVFAVWIARMFDITVASTTMEASMGKVALSAGALNIAFGALAIGIGAVVLIFKALNAEFDEMDARQAKNAEAFGKVKDIKTAGEHYANMQRELEKTKLKSPDPADYDTDPERYNAAVEAHKKKIIDAEFEVDRARKAFQGYAMAEFGKDPENKEFTGAPEDYHKNYMNTALADIKRNYDAEYNEIRSGEKKKLMLLDEEHEMGTLSTADWEKKKLDTIKEANEEELAYLEGETEEIKELYAKLNKDVARMPFKTGEDRKAYYEKLERDEESYLQALEAKKKITQDKNEEAGVKARVDGYKRLRTLGIDEAEFETKLALTESERLNNIETNRIQQKTELNDFFYVQGRKSATEYYNDAKKLIEDDFNRTIDYQNRKFLAEDEKLADEQERWKDNHDMYIKLQRQREELEQNARKDGEKAEQDRSKKQLDLWKKYQTDWKALFELQGGGMKGFAAVTEASLDLIVADFMNTGKQINQIWNDVSQSMADTFSNVFIDMAEGKLKSFGDYVNSFLTSVRNSIFKMMSQQIAGGLLKGGEIGFMSLFAHEGMPIMHGGGPVIPRYHGGGGLESDERVIIAQTGERVMSRKQNAMFEDMYNSSKSKGNVEINITNETGRPVTASKGSVQFDMNKMIINAVISDYQNYGPTRKVLGR